MAQAGLTTGASFAGASSASAPPFVAPTIEQVARALPHLEILELIGQGGMGCVFKARQPKLDRFVALKVLPSSFAQDPAFAARFEKEARALAALNHPNIVTIHDFGQSGGFYYLLMEFVDGVNLRQVLRSRKLAPREALAIIPPLCDALQFAHDRGIVHRDIKPENLLLDKTGRIKVADFGIAKILRADASAQDSARASRTGERSQSDHTDAETMAGTPRYMAPEQSKPGAETDHRTDIYSLGVVLYEMLTGEVPTGKFEAPSRRVLVDVRFDEIVLQALEKTPQLRFQSATDFRTKVETALREEFSSAATATSVTAPGNAPENGERFLGQTSCYVSDKTSLASFSGQFYHFRQVRELSLDSAYLSLVGAGQTIRIALRAIKDVSLGQYPRLMNPAGLDLISLTYEEKGEPKQIFLAPYPGSVFGAPSRFNEYVNIWFMKIRQAVEQATGKPPALTPASELGVPGSSRWLYLIFGMPLLGALAIAVESRALSIDALYPSLVAGGGFLFIALVDLGLLMFFRNKAKAKEPLRKSRRIAIGVIGLLIPLILIGFLWTVKRRSELDLEYQTKLLQLGKMQEDLDRDRASMDQNKAALIQTAVGEMVRSRDPRDPQKAKQFEPKAKQFAGEIEGLTGRQQEISLNGARIFQQKVALQRAIPIFPDWFGRGAAMAAALILSALFLVLQPGIPLIFAIAFALGGVGTAGITLWDSHSDGSATRELLDETSQAVVADLPGVAGRFGPIYGTFQPVTSFVHDNAVATASLAVQPRCLVALRTFIRQGNQTTTEIPAMSFWAVHNDIDSSRSFSFHWFAKTSNSGEQVLVLKDGEGHEASSTHAQIALPKGLVWKAIHPDPMAIGIVGRNEVLTYPIPGPAGYGQLAPKVWNRIPVLVGESPDGKTPPVEVLAHWAVFPLSGPASLRQPGLLKKLGSMPDNEALKEMRIAPDWWTQAMVVEAESQHMVVAMSGEGNPGFFRLTWKISSPRAKVAILRFRKEILKIDMEQDPETKEYGITLSGEFLKKSSTLCNLQWVLQKKVGSWILENWQIPEAMNWTYPAPGEPAAAKVWLNHPVELVQSQSDPVTIELADSDPDRPDPVDTLKVSTLPTGGSGDPSGAPVPPSVGSGSVLSPLPDRVQRAGPTGAANAPANTVPETAPAQAASPWRVILNESAELLSSYAKINGEIEYTIKRKGESHTWTKTNPPAYDRDPLRAAVALAASCTKEVEGDAATPEAWKKRAKDNSYFHATFDPPLPFTVRTGPKSETLKIKEILIPLPEDQLPAGVYLCEEGKVRFMQGYVPEILAALIKGKEFSLKNLPAYKGLFFQVPKVP
jgi:serine/threonine protein kinase